MREPGVQSPTVQREQGTGFRTATVIASVLAVCALAVDYGFRPLPDAAQFAVRVAEVLVVGFFVSHTALRIMWARRRLQHLRDVWYELVLVGLLLAALVTIGLRDRHGDTAYYILTIQITLFLFLFIRLTELIRLVSTSRFRPAQIFVASFATLIGLGTGLLMLPAATSTKVYLKGSVGSPLRGTILRRTGDHLLVQSGDGNHLVRKSEVARSVRAGPASFSTALFTATSAVCVTGLIVESTGGYWSPFGQTVILVLIQLGGLGIMTFGAVFALLLWQNLGLRQSAVMKDMMGPTMSVQVGRVLVFVLASTAVIECLGTWSLWHLWADEGMSTSQRLFYSAFHAVSAFCNAGFCLYNNSLERYGTTWQANGVFPVLIIVGGLGFMVIYNLTRIARCQARQLWTRLRGHLPKPELDRRRLTLQSKLVLLTTAALLVAGTGLVMVFETLPNRAPGPQVAVGGTGAFAGRAGAGAIRYHSGLPEDSNSYLMAGPPGDAAEPLPTGTVGPGERLAHSWFQSVTARTAGFNTTPTAKLTDSTKFLTALMMFIGASPGSTGGGIKTATLAVILCGIWSLLRNRYGAQAFKRTIPQNILLRSLVIMTLGVGVVAAATMLLSVTQSNVAFLDALFESTSAFGTVGLSTGVTRSLNLVGRLLIIVVMFVGRIGPLTLFIALPLGVRRMDYEYPTETVAIG